jgi:hypothetical protein
MQNVAFGHDTLWRRFSELGLGLDCTDHELPFQDSTSD